MATLPAAPAANIELTDDRRFAGRVARLAAVSLVALGMIWRLASRGGIPEPAPTLLLAGWIAMPCLLAASLFWPRLRPGLVAPSTLVTAGAAAAAWTAAGPARAGWVLLRAGILLGDLLGLWLWLRLAPVPRAWTDPFSRRRWAVIAVHVLLVVAGMTIVAAA
ncbi:MAG: hypothetical protein ACKOWF_19915 [Chloroflexota bacterium]